MKEYNLTCQEEDNGIRIDRVLSEYYEELSRSYIQKLIKENLIFINGKTCKASSKVVTNDYITFSTPDQIIPDIEPQNIPLDILYEDNDVIVVNKPKGMVVHPAPGHYSDTLVNGLMYYCKDKLSGINGVLRPGIVHRIDKDTTGSLIVCKNDKAHNDIAKQLKEHSINRIYTAIVHGVIEEDTGLVDAPIGRHPTDRLKMAINYSNGKRAVTHYKVIQRFDKYTLVQCVLETGRTHQIRVHMSSINHPILGDEIYSNIKSPFKLEGQTLHAGTLGFIQPTTGEYIEITAPLPEYFVRLIDIL